MKKHALAATTRHQAFRCTQHVHSDIVIQNYAIVQRCRISYIRQCTIYRANQRLQSCLPMCCGVALMPHIN